MEYMDQKRQALIAWNEFKKAYLTPLYTMQDEMEAVELGLLGSLEKVVPYQNLIAKYKEYNSRPELIVYTFLTYLSQNEKNVNLKPFENKIQEFNGQSCNYILTEPQSTIVDDFTGQIKIDCSDEVAQYLISAIELRFEDYKIFVQRSLLSFSAESFSTSNVSARVAQEPTPAEPVGKGKKGKKVKEPKVKKGKESKKGKK